MNHPICDSCFAICRFALSILHRRVKIIPPRGRFVKSFLAVFREKFLFASSSAEALLLGPLLFGGISRLFRFAFSMGSPRRAQMRSTTTTVGAPASTMTSALARYFGRRSFKRRSITARRSGVCRSGRRLSFLRRSCKGRPAVRQR